MPKKKKKLAVCAYCGETKMVTDEHVPPECLFKQAKPSDLIIIPACSDCNSGKSKDDEYFATMLSFREELLNHPDMKPIREAVQRSLNNPNKEKFRDAILSGFRIVDVVTPAGLYIGKARDYKVDLSRIKRTMFSILDGLFFHEKKTRLSTDFQKLVFTVENIEEMNKADKQECDRLMRAVDLIKNAPPVSIGNVFAYWVGFDANNPNYSAWLFLFFEKLPFVGITTRPL